MCMEMEVERNQENQKIKKKQSEGNIMKAINERMTRDVTDFFEQEENY